MKKIYLIATSILLFATASSAQIYDEHFESPVDQFVTTNVFTNGQDQSNFIIVSRGHDEWDVVSYALNNGTDATGISMTGKDTVYVRVRADYEGDVSSILSISLLDDAAVTPNNNEFNAINTVTLSKEWQTFKMVVPNWNNTFGNGLDTDSTNITSINFAPNSAFASFPKTNANGESVTTPFEGTIYIDYVSIGSDLSAGNELSVLTSYDHSFTTESINDIESAGSFTSTIEDESLIITSEGHEEWDSFKFPVQGGVIDISNGLKLGFTASATTEAPVGFMIAVVDELGTRIQYPELFTVQNLTSEDKSVVIDFNNRFENVADVTTPATQRITHFEILINQGFGSFASTNDNSVLVDESFIGEIKISELVLNDSPLGITSASTQKLDFFPNPAQNTINIANTELVSGQDYIITNLLGVEVANGQITDSGLDISSLSSGTYLISTTNNDINYSARIIVE